MPAIKKESFGKLKNGEEAHIFTLRNNKGNEVKVTDFGARIVSWRFRNAAFENKFVLVGHKSVAEYESDDKDLGVVFVDGKSHLADKIWNAEQTLEGVKFSIDEGGKKISVIYSVSNDNELSIKYEAHGDVDDVSTRVVFSGDALSAPDFKVFSNDFKSIDDGKWALIDRPAEVEMELGEFGFDIGCPIDYLDGGLKNGADIFSAVDKLLLKMYATQDNVHVEKLPDGFAIKTSGSKKTDDGVIKSQTVYVMKNRKE